LRKFAQDAVKLLEREESKGSGMANADALLLESVSRLLLVAAPVVVAVVFSSSRR
jgi:hypothetical protein